MSFFARLFQYFANDILVHSLANSKRFQRLALRIGNSFTPFLTHTHSSILIYADNFLNTNKKTIEEKIQPNLDKVVKTTEEKVKSMKNESKNFNFKSFMQELKDDVNKEIDKQKQANK